MYVYVPVETSETHWISSPAKAFFSSSFHARNPRLPLSIASLSGPSIASLSHVISTMILPAPEVDSERMTWHSETSLGLTVIS